MNISQHSYDDDFLKEFLDEFDFDDANFLESSDSLLLGDDLQADLHSNAPFGSSHSAPSQSLDNTVLPLEVSSG